jgi:hypothetical protein
MIIVARPLTADEWKRVIAAILADEDLRWESLGVVAHRLRSTPAEVLAHLYEYCHDDVYGERPPTA